MLCRFCFCASHLLYSKTRHLSVVRGESGQFGPFLSGWRSSTSEPCHELNSPSSPFPPSPSQHVTSARWRPAACSTTTTTSPAPCTTRTESRTRMGAPDPPFPRRESPQRTQARSIRSHPFFEMACCGRVHGEAAWLLLRLLPPAGESRGIPRLSFLFNIQRVPAFSRRR